MNILFIHQNFPGQFRHIATHLVNSPDHRILAVARQGCPGLPGVPTRTYTLHRPPARNLHHYLKPFEAGVLHGQAVIRLLHDIRKEGFVPDVILAHPGWGETLFIREIFPHARLLHYCEFYYHPDGADAGFDPEFPLSLDDRARIRSKNALHLLNLENCDLGVSPTHWQKNLHPAAYRDKIQVCHEGIDTRHLRPDPQAAFTLPSGKTLRPGDPVVTFVARNLEPYRGFHIFMRTLPEILARHPGCDIVIVGGDEASYCPKPADAPNWREKMQREVALDTRRVHFLGKIPYPAYRILLQVSAVHVYLTYPFVLSWSMLEAMACGCLLVASDTPPVREVVRHGENGLLVDFFDVRGLAGKVTQALANQQGVASLCNRAQHDVTRAYALENGIAGYRRLLGM